MRPALLVVTMNQPTEMRLFSFLLLHRNLDSLHLLFPQHYLPPEALEADVLL